MIRWLRRILSPTARERGLAGQLADEQAGHEATRRQLRIAQAEAESLAAVIARDRERVRAEAAGFTRQRAEHEGGTATHGRTD